MGDHVRSLLDGDLDAPGRAARGLARHVFADGCLLAKQLAAGAEAQESEARGVLRADWGRGSLEDGLLGLRSAAALRRVRRAGPHRVAPQALGVARLGVLLLCHAGRDGVLRVHADIGPRHDRRLADHGGRRVERASGGGEETQHGLSTGDYRIGFAILLSVI